MKKAIAIILSLILALAIGFGLPILMKDETKSIDANIYNETSLVKQEILSYNNYEYEYNKMYVNGRLIGVVKDLDYINELIELKYKDYEERFPNTSLGFDDSISLVPERSYINFENVDDQIMSFLVEKDLLGVKTTAVEFSTSEGVYDIIYVKNIDDFNTARDQFLLNFISESALMKLRNGEQIADPTELGTIETGISIEETIEYSEAIVSPSDIFTSVDDIYQYLCYGRNSEREYYTVKQGDTLQAVGYYFGDMSAKQIVMLNKDILSSEDQVIIPGMKLNVTYYTSPITVNVTKENLSQQFITPDAPEYIEDESIEKGKVKILVQEESGIKNALYREVWKNGVLQSGTLMSEKIIKQPIRGQVAVGTLMINMIGTGNYVWPVDNPEITCDFGCYLNHTGTDFVNKYNRNGPVYAIDSGVVFETGYKDDMGYYCMIDHQNGVRTFYMHLHTSSYVKEGENVVRGQVIGLIGNTGNSSGAHLHLTFEVDNERHDACNYLPCALIG